MEFRASKVAAAQNEQARKYLTKNLKKREAGLQAFEKLLSELGNVVDSYPDWHPILTAPPKSSSDHVYSIEDVAAYRGRDHTISFVRGFVTCPYSADEADRIVNAVETIRGLYAYRLNSPLYANNAYPVVVEAALIELEADGTICSRDALILFAEQAVKEMRKAQVAETWWNIRSLILGTPHGSRSSLFVNQHSGSHMRKFLEAFNASGVCGPIKEVSLDMLSQKKRKTIRETLLQAALNEWDKSSQKFEFNLRGETCKATVKDTWGDGEELSIGVKIGGYDLYVTGYYYPEKKIFTGLDPQGKRVLAEKFL